MPSTECEYDFVTKEWLLAKLRNDPKQLVILDCRSSNEYGESHVRDAVNFSIPSIMLRRLATGKIELASTIKCRDLKSRIFNTYRENLFVLYNDLCSVEQHLADTILSVLFRRLTQDGCRVVCLEGGFTKFRSAFPEWCASCSELLDGSGGGGGHGANITTVDPLPLMGLRSLRISNVPLRAQHRSTDSLSSTANSSTDSSDTDDRCDSSLGLEEDKEFPVEILPYLYLGNAANSEDIQALNRHSIQYVLNVTPDLPNVFQNLGTINYMQIPILDHWSQNAATHFPDAIAFIDEARSKQKGVLVHCLAGISRSVTITLAYIMYTCSLNLNDAFNLVRSRKSNISPNFNFMQQLANFEKELKLNESSQNPNVFMEQLQREQKEAQVCGGGTVGAAVTGTTTSLGGPRSQRQRKCRNCGLCDDCKCSQHSDFLSPLASIGVSPDSGIEFDRWASSSSNTNTPAE